MYRAWICFLVNQLVDFHLTTEPSKASISTKLPTDRTVKSRCMLFTQLPSERADKPLYATLIWQQWLPSCTCKVFWIFQRGSLPNSFTSGTCVTGSLKFLSEAICPNREIFYLQFLLLFHWFSILFLSVHIRADCSVEVPVDIFLPPVPTSDKHTQWAGIVSLSRC